LYLNRIKNNDFKYFFKFDKNKIKNKFVVISKYEDDIKYTNNSLNMGFFDYVMYLFFKINILENKKDEKLLLKTKRIHIETILNYPIKIKRLIHVLKRSAALNIRLKKSNKSIKNFVFYLTFIMSIILKVNEKRAHFKLRDLNLKLIRLLFFNRILTKLGFVFGNILRHIFYLITNAMKYSFKFCFLSNNSLNAKFLARYIGLKLKRKFPLFLVLNPIKKELKKLFFKKKEKKFSSLLSDYALNKNKSLLDLKIKYKKGFSDILLYLYKKYTELFVLYYKKLKTLITFDFYIYFFLLKNKYKNQMLLRKLFFRFFYGKKWRKNKKNIYLNNNWIFCLNRLIKNSWSVLQIVFLRKLFFFSELFLYVKNKLLINLFFGFNKYHIDKLAYNYFSLKFNKNTFFYININYINLFMFIFFYNYIFLNFNTILYMDSQYILISNYFFKSFMYYNYSIYNFNKFSNYFKINKKKKLF